MRSHFCRIAVCLFVVSLATVAYGDGKQAARNTGARVVDPADSLLTSLLANVAKADRDAAFPQIARNQGRPGSKRIVPLSGCTICEPCGYDFNGNPIDCCTDSQDCTNDWTACAAGNECETAVTCRSCYVWHGCQLSNGSAS